jgi:hypothetical protein
MPFVLFGYKGGSGGNTAFGQPPILQVGYSWDAKMSAVTKHIHTTRNNSTIGPVYLPRPPGCMAAACRVSRMSVHVLHTLADVLFILSLSMRVSLAGDATRLCVSVLRAWVRGYPALLHRTTYGTDYPTQHNADSFWE